MNLLPFPRTSNFVSPEILSQEQFNLRSATLADVPFLRELYYQSREEELGRIAWLPSQKKIFLDSQFDLQHHHYLTYYADANFLLIEHQSIPIGRFYLQLHAHSLWIIDISLLATWRNRGIGSKLIRYTQKLTQNSNATLNLHVERHNHGAHRLYTRLGFTYSNAKGANLTHLKMQWPGKY